MGDQIWCNGTWLGPWKHSDITLIMIDVIAHLYDDESQSFALFAETGSENDDVKTYWYAWLNFHGGMCDCCKGGSPETFEQFTLVTALSSSGAERIRGLIETAIEKIRAQRGKHKHD